MAQITLNTTGVASNGALVLQSNGTTAAVTIDTSQRAAFVAGTAALPAITTTGDTNTGIFFPAADTIGFAEGGAEAMRLDSSGNLGIGTSSPAVRLDVNGVGGALSAVNPPLQVWDTTALAANIGGGIAFGGNYTGSTKTNWAGIAGLKENATDNNYSGYLAFYTRTNGSGNAERMRLDASGNLLVGTTSKFAGGIDGFDLNTTGETGITFGKSGVVKNYFYLITNESAFQWQTVSGVAVNIISSTNGVTLANGGTSWGSLSDERKKDIIEPITDATTKVSSLRAVIGKYKTEEDGIRRAMLIAQDVQAVLPEAVTENADGDLILQYTDTIPLLVAAIKEQTALITTLTARITALESA